MADRRYCSIGFEEALAAGYRVSRPNRPKKALRELCSTLGDEYHLASIDYGNVIHRVVGDGWDIEIFPSNKSCTKYHVVLWRGYGTERIMTDEDVPPDCVGNSVEMILHLYVPKEVYPTRYNLGPRLAMGNDKD